MNATAGKKRLTKFPRKKVHSLVQTALPKGRKFTLQVIDSHIGKMKVVRVVTPAWKNLSPSGRIEKILRAAEARLTPKEKKQILRFSVLTRDELRRISTPDSRSRKSTRKPVLAD